MRTRNPLLALLLGGCLLAGPIPAAAKMSIVNTKHNLSVSGPGEIRALTESRICIFCHTPHNASPRTPLWNREIEPTNYILYESSTLAAIPSPPTGPSRLCLSCHDGTVALGQVLSRPGGIATTMEITSGRPSYLGTDISDDHPVSFSYHGSLPNPELKPSPPAGLLFYGPDVVHCSTCHDAHDDTYGKFLVMDNTASALCTTCHDKQGWSGSAHQLAANTWNGAGTDPWPHTDWMTVAENGCENCHSPHSAGGPERLLNYREEERNCLPCHNGNVAATDIESEFQKASRHRPEANTIGLTATAHDPAESPLLLQGHVECADCHNPHAVSNRPASAPDVSGRLERVVGVDRNGVATDPAASQYEICFKCHADSNQVLPVVQRVINENNTRLEFATANPSYHPVIGPGQNLDVPSLPGYEAGLTVSSLIYCTDCHDSDASPAVGGTGPRGPHGSIYAPILRQRYETTYGTPNTEASYALCFQCHTRESILAGWGGGENIHLLHLNHTVPCASCHDPHGVRSAAGTGDHTHLINFDTSAALPVAGQAVPFFTDKGSRSGSCTLVCHGETHTDSNSSYP